METKEQIYSTLKNIVDLLEENGYRVFKAEEIMYTEFNPSKIFNLQITINELFKKNV